MVTQQLQRTKVDRPKADDEGDGSVVVRASAVAKVAGMTVREMEGVNLGAMGGVMASIVGAGPGMAQEIRRGVKAAITDNGKANVDVWITVDYGLDIPEVVTEVRSRISERVLRMTGLETKRVNIEVTDISLPNEAASPAAD